MTAQASLFDAPPTTGTARKADRQTSRDAAKAKDPGPDQMRCLDALRINGGVGSIDTVCQHFARIGVWRDRGPLSRRLTDLADAGLIVDSGEVERGSRDDFGLTPFQRQRLTARVLDVLDAYCEPRGGCWIWRGVTNNKGLPYVRLTVNGSMAYRSTSVLLDKVLNDSDGSGIRYPVCESGKECVNPDHKQNRGEGRWVAAGVGDFTAKEDVA